MVFVGLNAELSVEAVGREEEREGGRGERGVEGGEEERERRGRVEGRKRGERERERQKDGGEGKRGRRGGEREDEKKILYSARTSTSILLDLLSKSSFFFFPPLLWLLVIGRFIFRDCSFPRGVVVTNVSDTGRNSPRTGAN